MVNVKTPNKKRKSFANAEGATQGGQTPKGTKLDTSLKTPGKGKGNATPGKPNKTPQNNAQTPKMSPKGNAPKTPKQTPFKNQEQGSGKKNKRNKRASESESEGSPPKKLMMFSGTSELQESEGKKQPGPGAKVQPNKQAIQKKKDENKEARKIKKKGQFFQLKEKINGGDKAALQELEAKIKAFEERKDLTKTAKRKLKLLQRLRGFATGEKKVAQAPPSASKKKKERQNATKAEKKNVQGEPAKQAKGAQKKIVQQKVLKKANDDEEADSDESDYEVEAEIQPDTIIKAGESLEGEESDDDEDSGEEVDEEDESGDEEEEDSDEEDESDEEEAKPVQIQKGGKKKGEEKKNEVRAKNLKLQAMRKQGQLAGSVKENQKRSARRGKKNAKAVNGASP